VWGASLRGGELTFWVITPLTLTKPPTTRAKDVTMAQESKMADSQLAENSSQATHLIHISFSLEKALPR